MADKIFFKTGLASSLPTTKTAGQLLFAIDETTGSIYLDKDSNTRVKFNADAVKLATARNITISGTASNSVGTFDGGDNTTIYIPTTISGFNSISTKKIVSPANNPLYITPASTLYLDSGTSSSIIFRQGGTARVRFDTTGLLRPESNNVSDLGSSSYKWKNVYATTFTGALNGNAATATKLETAHSINGTSFDGRSNITTSYWGTERIISISSTAGVTGTGIDGSDNKTLVVPSTMTGFDSITSTKLIATTVTSDTGHIVFPDGGQYTTTTSSKTGYLKITLPVSWTNAMMRFYVDIYNYSTGTSATYIIGGYNYASNSAWQNVYAQAIGTPGSKLGNLSVRFGHDGSKCAIYIGAADTSWNYPQIMIRDLYIGFTQDEKNYTTGWSIDFTTTLGTISQTVENTNVAYKLYTARSINGTNFDGSGDITTANWGATKNITIKDGSGNKGTAVPVNGSTNVELILPTTIAATVSAANKLTVNAGDSNTPVYFEGGIPKAITSIDVKSDKAAKLDPGAIINGTTFTGETEITTSYWGTARTLTIGNTGKSVNGNENVSWSLSEIGASDTKLLRNNYVSFTVGGDADTYYPVLIDSGHGSLFGWEIVSISRSYSATAPDTWNTATHKGALTLTLRWSGDTGWGGNDKTIVVEEFKEQYSTMVGGLNLSVNGLIVWLRGGDAIYYLTTPYGKAATATVHLTDYTASDKKVYSARSYSADTVNTEVKGKWYLRSNKFYGSASKLMTAWAINGTNFDGSGSITTSYWGMERTISISSTAGTTGTKINGSKDKSLVVPSTMTGFTSITSTTFVGNLSGKATSADTADSAITASSCTGNAATAGKLITARNIAISETASSSIGTFDGNDNTIIYMPLTIQGFNEIKTKKLTITNTDGGVHLAFSRPSWNYITAPVGGYIAFSPNGRATSGAGATLSIGDSQVIPGYNNNIIDLGSSSYKWKNVYATTFTGDLNGNAATATKLEAAPSINGTSFDGRSGITTSYWGTIRTLTIGNTGKSVNGSKDVSWSLSEIGALALSGGTLTGALTAPSYVTSKSYSISPEGTDEGWYRCATLTSGSGTSNNFILSIRRTYYSPENEGYLFAISNDRDTVNITQLSGSIGGHILTKIRVNIDENRSIHIDYYMTSNGTASYKNTYYVSGWGDGTVYNPYKITSITGTTTEFETVLGLKNNVGFIGNASSATKLETARNIAISEIANSSIGTFDGSDNTIVYMPTTISGFNSISTKKITSPASTALYVSPTSTLYLDSGASTSIVFRQGGTARARFNTAGHFTPETSNTYYLGTSSLKWKSVYATTFYGDLNGNATTTTTLATSRAFRISDTANSTSTASFNGSTDATLYIPTTIKEFTSIESDKYVVNDKVTLQYNATNECLEFVFA